jgi:hypothetical protein
MLVLLARALSCSPSGLDDVPIARLMGWLAQLEKIKPKPST